MVSPITYKNDRLLYEIELRTSRVDSVFLYYILEGWDHLCFYSTLDFEKCQRYRDIRIYCTIEMKPLLQKILLGLDQKISMERLSERVFSDQ
ncbi:MAG: DUF4911 domain-containing protein [Bacteriovoracales bacterium]|nr:DUF4911 domain-containing protein [Bacteriovoracales bacterium]